MKQILFVMCLTSLLYNVVYAEESTVLDSLNNILDIGIETKNDTLILRIKLDLINYHFTHGEFGLVDSIFTNFTKEEIEDSDLVWQSKYYTSKVRYYGVKKDLENAMRCVTKAIELNLLLRDTNQLMVNYANKGNLNLMNEDYSLAVENYRKSLNFAFVQKNENRQALLYSNMSSLYNRLGKYDQGISSAKDAIVLAQKVNNVGLEANAYNNLCLNLYKTNSVENDSLLNILFRTLELNTKVGNINGIARATNNIGTLKYKLGDTDALPYLKEAEKLYAERGMKLELETNFLSQARYYQINNEPNKSIKYYNKVLGFENLKFRERVRCYEGLCKANLALGKTSTVRLYLDSLLSNQDSLMLNVSDEKILKSTTDYKNRIYQDSLKYLKLDKENNRVKASRYQFGLLSALLAMILGLFLLKNVYSKYQEKLDENEELIFEISELSNINNRLKSNLEKINIQSNLLEQEIKFKHLDRTHSLATNQISFISAEQNGVRINTVNTSYWTDMSLKSLLDSLPESQFVQVHRGAIVNVTHIEWVNHSSLKLKSGDELKIGRTYKNKLKEMFT